MKKGRKVRRVDTAWLKGGYAGRKSGADPEIESMRTIIRDSGMSLSEIMEKSGVSKSTIKNWTLGKTKRPQNITLRAVGRACGFDRAWARIN